MRERGLGSLRNPSQPRTSSAATGFGVHAPPVAVAEFDEATSPTNHTIPVVADEARRLRWH